MSQSQSQFISAKESVRVSNAVLSEAQSGALSIGAIAQYRRPNRQARGKGERASRFHGCSSSDRDHTFQDRKAQLLDPALSCDVMAK